VFIENIYAKPKKVLEEKKELETTVFSTTPWQRKLL